MALIRPVRSFTPRFGERCFLAETAVIIGDVIMGNECSVWYNAVVRGDVHSIRIGNRTNIQDGAVIHCTYQKASTQIGNNVTIGHLALVHGCTIEDNVLVGMGAKILDHAVVQSEVIIAAGAVVLEKSVLESGWLYAGIPVKKIKPLTDAQLAGLRTYADNYVMYSQWFQEPF
ncbi:MAG: gamma carbonic anhydrase family protein [Bacteroidia bacterium]|nr:gamma carbonic anhydrase family protein [Bacteroidia bacterium]